jgi:hypothetical protein
MRWKRLSVLSLLPLALALGFFAFAYWWAKPAVTFTGVEVVDGTRCAVFAIAPSDRVDRGLQHYFGVSVVLEGEDASMAREIPDEAVNFLREGDGVLRFAIP